MTTMLAGTGIYIVYQDKIGITILSERMFDCLKDSKPDTFIPVEIGGSRVEVKIGDCTHNDFNKVQNDFDLLIAESSRRANEAEFFRTRELIAHY